MAKVAYHVQGVIKPKLAANLHHKPTLTRRQINDFNNSYCLDCKIPSNDKSINDKRYSSFSHPNIEKSDSTDAVLANTVAIPVQKSRSAENFPSTIVHPALNVVL